MRWSSLAALLLAACSGQASQGAGEPAGTAVAKESTAHAAPAALNESGASVDEPAASRGRRRVLVTGFNDWKDLGSPPNVWRCRDNPSCRLLIGPARDSVPDSLDGPLVVRLRTHDAIDWEFATLPVTWGAFEALDTADYDVVVNLGLGVYDRFDRLQLEQGAYNARRGADAAGATVDGAIDPAASAIVRGAPADSGIDERLAALSGRDFVGYEVAVASARAENTYLCNETHYRALARLEDSHAAEGRLAQVYFLHIPYAREGDYEALAQGVAGLVAALVE